jgi:potassium/hydrogen antiporter
VGTLGLGLILYEGGLQASWRELLAGKLGLLGTAPHHLDMPLELSGPSLLDMVEFIVSPEHAIVGTAVRDLGRPSDAVIAIISRGDESILPRGQTVIEVGDRLHVLIPQGTHHDLEDVFFRWGHQVRPGSS